MKAEINDQIDRKIGNKFIVLQWMAKVFNDPNFLSNMWAI